MSISESPSALAAVRSGDSVDRLTVWERVSGRVEDAFWFVLAYLTVLTIHRTLDRHGWNCLRERLEGLPKRKAGKASDSALVQRIERGVLAACRWQWRSTACLPRSILAYRLLRWAGFQPTLYIGFRVPIMGHAWVELNGAAIADDMTPSERAEFKVTTRLGAEDDSKQSTAAVD